MALLDELRRLPPRTILATAAMQVPLLAALWNGALGYLTLQVLLATELVVLNLATIPFYRERGAGRHLRDTLLIAGGLLFVLFFLLVTYGVALGLEAVGVAANVDAVLGTLMVVLRFGLSLVAATITPREMDAIAANPYAR